MSESRMIEEQDVRQIKRKISAEKAMSRCPFCGGMPRIEILSYHKKNGADDIEADKARIYCRVCGASTKVWEHDANDEVIDNDAVAIAQAAWSMRARS